MSRKHNHVSLSGLSTLLRNCSPWSLEPCACCSSSRFAWTHAAWPGSLQTWKGTIIAQSRTLSRPCVHHACSPATSRPQAAAQELKELIASYQTLREGGRGTAICATIAETARQCNLDRDVQLPEESSLDSLTLDDRDTVVGRVYSK